MKPKRDHEKTPNGGDYSEIRFCDQDGNAVDEKEATRCVTNEYKNTVELICTTYGVIRKK